MPVGRFKYENYKSELTIKNIRTEDEGIYECKGSIGTHPHIISSQPYGIEVKVQGKLEFHD